MMRISNLVPFAILLITAGNAAAQDKGGQHSNPDSSGPRDYRSRTIYFLITDRFHAHEPYAPYVDPKYPDATNSVNCFVENCTSDTEFRKYWGGDIPGVIQKLDYLNDLGASALWLTPLMENVRAYVGGTGYGTGYHGYWVQNYYRVNAHFGDWNDVTQLSDQLHLNRMRYIQDITLNHSNPKDNHVYGRLFESSTADQVFIKNYHDDFDTATGTRYYKHYQRDQRCQDAKNIPDYNWSYWQLHHCLLADLSGYNQRNPQMAEYLLGAGKTWIDHGVDDFRMDAVKFPFPEFIATFTRTMREHLASLDRPAPYFVGEWSNGGVGDAKSIRFADNYKFFGTNILDFKLSLALNRFIGGGREYITEQITAFDLDNFLHERVQAFEGRDTWQGTFIDNHDQMRTMVRLRKLGYTDENEQKERMDLATVLLMTVRGIPIIYYGDEQYLADYNDQHSTPPEFVNSDNDDPFNRPGMKQWDENTSAFKIIRTLAKLRKESRAISEGGYRTVYVDPDILMFERIQQGRVVLVAVNRGEAKTVSLKGKLGIAPGEYTGLLADASDVNQGNYLAVASGRWALHLNKLSSLVVRP
jgi:cyclomaltodextrin glucanotransferase